MQRGRNSRQGSPSSRRYELSGPLNTEKAILARYVPVGVDTKMLKLPKEPLSLYVRKLANSSPHFLCENGLFEGREYWRATVHTENGPNDIVGVGDHASKKEAERLAALSAILQAAQQGKLHIVLSPSYAPPLTEPTLSDGTVLTLDRAQVFMDFYCHKFGFEPPTTTAQERQGRWEVTMFVDGTRLGGGVGINKKLATAHCYLTAVANLDQTDSELWSTFLEETKGRGDAIGLAPPVYVSLVNRVSDPVRLLCNELTNSELYAKSPADVQVISSVPGASPLIPRSESKLDKTDYQGKSGRLRQFLDDYMLNSSHATMRDQRFSLPIHTRAKELLELVNSQDVTICTAATGSGKTTQIPQIILDDWIKRGEGSKCNIICTQPRRIAAISVAERVAKERGQNAGPNSQIGYQVRFDAKLPAMHGSVTFCTTGIFLKRMQGALLGEGETHDDRSLDDVTHIIIDEVHERDVDTDLSLAVIKRLLNDRRNRNKPLKVILMSATIDPSLFQSYFGDENGNKAKVIDIPGRSFPVNKRYLEDILLELAKENLATAASNWVLNERSVAEYLAKEVGPGTLAQLRQPNYSAPLRSQTDGSSGEDLDIPFPLVALTIAHVLARSESGHVLVFLPGWEEIQAVNRILWDPRKYPLYGCDFTDRSKYSIHLLHSTIPVAEQQQVFEPAAPSVRRIILATNIAETSITIPDVVYVVDTGKVKEKRYDPERHMSSLVSAWVGSSNLNQRAGRAGRHRAGEYYGLVSKARVETLNPYQLVEMKRADLSNVVMHVKALDFPGMDVEEIFSSLIEPPALTRVHAALGTLQMVGALTSSEELTPLGRVLLQLPIDATLGRMVLYGALFRALDSALTLAAVLSNREPFNFPPQLKAEATAAKLAWCPPGVPEARSDPLAAIRAYDAWWALQSVGRYSEANEFCNRNFLNKPVLLTVTKIKLALLQALYQCGVLEIVTGKKIGKPNMRGSVVGREARAYVVPDELNINRDSLAVLGALIAAGSPPNFAVRTSERAFRTYSDKAAIIHPTSTNATISLSSRASTPGHPKESWERYMIAFVEKSRNVAAGQAASSATTFLRNTTRLDALQYMLFGAHQVITTPEGVECDGWLPIHGGARGGLGLIAEFKNAFERCMQRVFEGIHASNVERRQAKMKRIGRWAAPPLVSPPSTTSQVDDDPDEDRDAEAADEREVENEDNGDNLRLHRVATPLSSEEMLELGILTRDVVHVLEAFSDDRRMFRIRSRPGTPTSGYTSTRGSPGGGAGRARLPDEGGSAFARGLRASGVYGAASPLGGMSPMPSRPTTPFREGWDYSSGRH